MFHRILHVNPNVYGNAIQKQNSYLNTHRVVPIKVFHEELMWAAEDNEIHQSTRSVRSATAQANRSTWTMESYLFGKTFKRSCQLSERPTSQNS